MKKLFLLLFVTIAIGFMNSCQQDEKHFHLEGEIKGLGDSCVLLYGIFNNPDSILKLPVNGGKFSCSLPLDTITPLFLLLEDAKLEYPIFADKGVHSRIQGDTAKLNNLIVTGGMAQEEFNTFTQSIAPLKDYFEVRQMADSFIVAHPHSIVSVYLIYKYFVNAPSPEKSEIESICKQLSGNMQDNPYISRLLSSMETPGRRINTQHLNITNLADTTGTIIKANTYKDNYVVLSIWASWHPESRIMQDSLQANIKRFAKESVKFVNISLDSDRDLWLNAIREDSLGGIHLCDFKGWNGAFIQTTSANDLPKNFVLNHTGKILVSDMWGKKLDNFLDKQLTQWKELKARQKKTENNRKKRR